MKCPVCTLSILKAIQPEENLTALWCPTCDGQWIGSDSYWSWLAQQDARLPEKPPGGTPIEVADRQRAKLCPECSHIMLRYRVGHGFSFTLDQCGHCQGIWFDTNEWAALRERNLHDEVHLIFSAPWQAAIRQEDAHKLLESIYTEYFQDDYDKVREIKQWIDQHPQGDKILDYLVNPDPYSITAS
jgi:Zn-finger nucleic acid-binding protein